MSSVVMATLVMATLVMATLVTTFVLTAFRELQVLGLWKIHEEAHVVVHVVAVLEMICDPGVRLAEADSVTLMRMTDALDAVAQARQELFALVIVALARVVRLDLVIAVVVEFQALLVVLVTMAMERLVARTNKVPFQPREAEAFEPRVAAVRMNLMSRVCPVGMRNVVVFDQGQVAEVEHGRRNEARACTFSLQLALAMTQALDDLTAALPAAFRWALDVFRAHTMRAVLVTMSTVVLLTMSTVSTMSITTMAITTMATAAAVRIVVRSVVVRSRVIPVMRARVLGFRPSCLRGRAMLFLRK